MEDPKKPVFKAQRRNPGGGWETAYFEDLRLVREWIEFARMSVVSLADESEIPCKP